MNDSIVIIKILEQRCIGYSDDFSLTHFHERVILLGGQEATVFTTVRHGQLREISHSWDAPVIREDRRAAQTL